MAGEIDAALSNALAAHSRYIWLRIGYEAGRSLYASVLHHASNARQIAPHAFLDRHLRDLNRASATKPTFEAGKQPRKS